MQLHPEIKDKPSQPGSQTSTLPPQVPNAGQLFLRLSVSRLADLQQHDLTTEQRMKLLVELSNSVHDQKKRFLPQSVAEEEQAKEPEEQLRQLMRWLSLLQELVDPEHIYVADLKMQPSPELPDETTEAEEEELGSNAAPEIPAAYPPQDERHHLDV